MSSNTSVLSTQRMPQRWNTSFLELFRYLLFSVAFARALLAFLTCWTTLGLKTLSIQLMRSQTFWESNSGVLTSLWPGDQLFYDSFWASPGQGCASLSQTWPHRSHQGTTSSTSSSTPPEHSSSSSTTPSSLSTRTIRKPSRWQRGYCPRQKPLWVCPSWRQLMHIWIFPRARVKKIGATTSRFWGLKLISLVSLSNLLVSC